MRVNAVRPDAPSLGDRNTSAAMPFNLASLRNVSLEDLSTCDARLLLAQARALQSLIDAGHGRSLLRGKNLGLLCDADDREDGLRFRRAATDLGARVAQIRPDLSADSPNSKVIDTGRMLGRLYDGIECVGLNAEVVKCLGAAANVPVFDGISSVNHPTARLAAQLDGRQSDESHRLMLQAILLSSLN
jgi:ornithine carbamoyltransferase